MLQILTLILQPYSKLNAATLSVILQLQPQKLYVYVCWYTAFAMEAISCETSVKPT